MLNVKHGSYEYQFLSLGLATFKIEFEVDKLTNRCINVNEYVFTENFATWQKVVAQNMCLVAVVGKEQLLLSCW